MSNFKTHATFGFGVAVVANIVKQASQKCCDPTRRFDFGEMFAWGAVGVVITSIPDILEPAIHPNHRSFFHSIGLVAIILYLTKGKPAKTFSDDQRHSASLISCSYLAHLALDFLTKKGLPII